MSAIFTGLLMLMAPPPKLPPLMGIPPRIVSPEFVGFCQDAWEFGFSAQQAKDGFYAAQRHREWIFTNTNAGTRPKEWALDANWCVQCWDTLDNLLGGHLSSKDPEFHQTQCKRLYLLLGPKMYHGRRMPPTSPGWIFEGLVPNGVFPPSGITND